MKKIREIYQDIGIGFSIGVLTFFTMYLSSPEGRHYKDVKIFQREEKPAVMRMYRKGADSIFVEDLNNRGNYIFLDNYLKEIPNKSDRKIEEAEIKKAVGWYEE